MPSIQKEFFQQRWGRSIDYRPPSVGLRAHETILQCEVRTPKCEIPRSGAPFFVRLCLCGSTFPPFSAIVHPSAYSVYSVVQSSFSSLRSCSDPIRVDCVHSWFLLCPALLSFLRCLLFKAHPCGFVTQVHPWFRLHCYGSETVLKPIAACGGPSTWPNQKSLRLATILSKPSVWPGLTRYALARSS